MNPCCHRIKQENGELLCESVKLAKENGRLKEENSQLYEQNRDYALLRKVFGSEIRQDGCQGKKAQKAKQRERIR